MYTVTGITGQVGGATARALIKDGKKVRGVVRDKAKAAAWEAAGVELVVAQEYDPAALEAAFRGTEGVFVMIPPYIAPAAGYPEAREILAKLHQALDPARPPKVVYLSSIGAQHSTGLGLITQLHMLEEQLGALPIPNAFIRAAWFMENFQWDVQPAQQGKINAFLNPPDRAIPMVATEDIGRLAARILQTDWKANRYLELEGPRRYSQLDVAAAFSRLLGRSVVAKPVPREMWAAVFEKQGMPADRTGPRTEMLDGINSGWVDFARTGTEHFKGIRTLEEVLGDLIRKAG